MSFSGEVVAVAVITGVFMALAWIVGGVLGGVLAVLLIISCTPIRVAARVDDIDVQEMIPDAASTDLMDWNSADNEQPGPTAWTVQGSLLFGLVRFKSRGGPGQVDIAELRVLGVRRHLQSGRGDRRKEPQEAQDERRRKQPRMGQRGRQRQDPKDRNHRSRRSRRSLSNPADLIRIARAVIQETPWFIPRLWRALALRLRGDLTYGFEDPFLTGMSQAVLANVSLPADLRLTPDYSDGCLVGWVEATATVYPIKVVGIVLGTALRPAMRQLWWPRLRSAMRLTKAA